MSHGKVRDDKACLNCEAPVPGRFCTNCGQENIEPKQTVWHLVNHFFSDVTHFDGKFFVTVKDLFLKPGFLSKEYVKGRRVSYLDPIRMYIFTSAFFFLIFFTIVNLHELEKGRITGLNGKFQSARKTALAAADNHADSVSINAGFDAVEQKAKDDPSDHSVLGRMERASVFKTDSANHVRDSLDHIADSVGNASDKDDDEKDSVVANAGGVHVKVKKSGSADEDDKPLSLDFSDDGKEYSSVPDYDSAQAKLPADRRDGWLKRAFQRKQIETNEKWRGDREGMWREWVTTFIHNFPKMLFISLPLFALLLKMLYVRRKEFYYVDHGIFSVHLYIYSFLVLLLFFGFRELHSLTHWKPFSWLEGLLLLYPFWYYYKSMRNFYHQSRGKTLLKYFTLLFLSFIFQLILFLLFFIFTIAQT